MNGDVTVKKLLLIGFGLAILLVVGLSSVSLWQFQGNKAGVVMLTQSDMPLALTLGEIKNNILMHRRYEKDFLLNIGNAEKQQKYLESFAKASEKIKKDIQKVAAMIAADDELAADIKQKAAGLEDVYLKYHDGFLAIAAQISADPSITPQQGNKMFGEIKQVTYDLEEGADLLFVAVDGMIAETASGLLSVTKTTQYVLFFGLVGGGILMLLVGLAINRKISGSLQRVVAILSETSSQVHASASAIAEAGQVLADGASEQAAGIEETSSSMEEMSSQTKRNAENSAEAEGVMRETAKVISLASQSMGELTASMGEISAASEQTSKIVKTIDEIAFQTNLLALNAAVEAARAGEAGAGFAVVADEVRNLAMRAAEAARNTAELIEGTVEKVRGGSALVGKTSEEFGKVSAHIGKVDSLMSEIHTASDEQAKGISQINQAIGQMDQVIQQVAANAEEAAGHSEELGGQTEVLQIVVLELAALAGTEVGGSGGQRPAAKKNTQARMALSQKPGQARKKPLAALPPGANRGASKKPEEVIPFGEDDFEDF
ncbi:methyl-accepting chemotaxis protein [Thiovibrio frasassiensis]|uniref:Methyl-accepting chemotaxis protein n=1 Tax=Thiovibrio frasassiensis TaxID=2984131 RepID=A0A9X4MC44_9BACT|nr:methyl-accepting chemotaxis protein [Thiovibrio frasassiensis]MDG4474751.1 methyl-accepting chemotaxis protein [Thiovibrio frasassiensis]